ncbi:unnamed protein product [Chrysoparadoxa australica]
MLALFLGKAPNLAPAIIPGSFKSLVSAADTDRGLIELASGGNPKQMLEGLKWLNDQRTMMSDSVEGDEDEAELAAMKETADNMKLALKTSLDLDKRTFHVESIRFVGHVEAELSSLERMLLHQIKAQGEAGEMLDVYTEHFSKSNTVKGKPSPSLQEVCSLAYAIKVAVSNMTGWTAQLGKHSLPLAANASLSAVLDDLVLDTGEKSNHPLDINLFGVIMHLALLFPGKAKAKGKGATGKGKGKASKGKSPKSLKRAAAASPARKAAKSKSPKKG